MQSHIVDLFLSLSLSFGFFLFSLPVSFLMRLLYSFYRSYCYVFERGEEELPLASVIQVRQ